MDEIFIVIGYQLLMKIFGNSKVLILYNVSFATKFSRDDYEHEIIEQTTLLLMWIVLHRIDCKSTYLFKRKYLLLSKDQISLFIHWIVYLRVKFSCVGIEALKFVYNNSISKTCDIQISLHDNIALSHVDEDFEDEHPI